MTNHREQQEKAFERNRIAFDEQLGRLLAAHEGKFALVHEPRVVSIHDSMDAAYGEGVHRFGLDPIFIGHIVRTPVPIHMPTLVYGLIHAHL